VELAPKGFPGNSPTGFNFSVRRFVNGTRRRLGGDVHYTPGPLGLRFEVLRGTEERKAQGSVFDDLPAEVASGWAASGTWLVTGHSKKRSIDVERGLHQGSPGAIEIGARYERLRFDDDGEDAGFEGAGNRARNIRPVSSRALTVGVSWWPVGWIRLMGNVVVERFTDELLAPVPGKKGRYVALLGRAQVAVP
jgi:phosphate-selective porin